jgi:ribulose-phosphate 3-epimerase
MNGGEGDMKKNVLIAPSILAADFSKLGDDIKAVERAGADWIHVDVMDGHFVPNITIGPLVVKGVRKSTKLVLESHLMISDPGRYIDEFAKAGSDIITFHIESCGDPGELVSRIRSHNVKAGASIKPKTGIDALEGVISDLDLVLVMTVEPGFGGQEFMRECLDKIRALRKIYKGDIAVDGGINPRTAGEALEAGANVLVAGTAVFGTGDYAEAIEKLRKGGE